MAEPLAIQRRRIMKKIFAIIILAGMVLMPQFAQAEDTGLYLAPKFLMTIQDTGSISKPGIAAGTGVDEYSQFTLGGALAVGYDFWVQQMVPIRLEIEWALRGNSKKNWSDKGTYFKEVKGVWNNSTLFANLFWDFHNDTNFTPYVGAGLGVAFTYTGYTLTANNNNKYTIDEQQTNFAWNVGTGVSYAFNEMISVDASYRFVDVGYNEMSTHFNGRNYETSNTPYNNEFMLGLRFSF